jgi:hypothetical protein
MPTAQPAARTSPVHIHIAGLQCPVCDQPIPNEKAEQVRARMEARERELSDAVTNRLKEQFAQERVQIEANARVALEKLKGDSAEAIEAVKREAAQKEAAVREAGLKAGQAAAQEQITALVRTNAAATAAAQEQIAALTQTNSELQAAAQEKLAEAEGDKVAALARYQELQASQETIIGQRVNEAREALEKAKTEAVNAVKAEQFTEKQKLTGKLEELTRQLEKKSAEERGEGAEVNLFEALKEAFPRDNIKRVGKGAQGADIIHEFVHNNKVCGRIVYDCKDRSQWRDDYATKLRADQIAAKAEHAILSSRTFPKDQRQLCERGGVLIANPARVIALVQLIRRHAVQLSTLRLSNEKRAQKTAALYEFIRSERCAQLFERIDAQAAELLKLQEKEKKDHDSLWKKQGTLFRGVQKACGDLTSEIDRIIEVAD